MKRDATIDNNKTYDKQTANFHIDIESEEIAYEKGIRKLAKKARNKLGSRKDFSILAVVCVLYNIIRQMFIALVYCIFKICQ